jgi:predicted permease
VAPRGFTGVIPVIRTDAWVPLMMAEQLGREKNALANAGSGWLMLVGRLKDGATIDASRAELTAVAKAHLAEEPEDLRVFTGIAMSRVTGFPADASGAIYGFVALLFAASALVLVIASVNVAGMLLARATARRREMAVRIALGAGRGRLVRQLLTESVVLFVAGALGGVIIAVGGSQLFGRVQLPVEVPIGIELTPDFRVLAFALGSALLTGLVFGLAPALQATRNDPSVSLRSDSAGAGARRSRVRSVLVAGQMALSLLLLMAAGLFVRAFDRGQRVDPGFERAHVATAPVMVGTAGYTEPRARLFNDALRERLLAAPGVTAVSFTRWVPLTNERAETSIIVDGFTPPAGRSRDGAVDVDFGIVSPDFLDVMRIPLVRGRSFAATDDSAAVQVALVNETFVKRYLADRESIGSTFKNDGATVTIVGVVRDAKYSSLDEDARPFMYLALAQNWRSSSNVLVRTTGDAASLGPIIRDAVRAVDPLLPVPDVITMENATSVVLLPQRIAAMVTAIMGLLGLTLAAVGLYGVVAYTASLRTREIGVRLALGAPGGSVLRLIMRDGMRLVAIGMAIGLLLAAVLTRVMTRFLFGVSPLDPLVFAVIPLALAGVALLANFLPAHRAAATDPVVALRAD